MSTTTARNWQYLERDPSSSDRQLSIKGRRIRARTLYGAYMSEEDPHSMEAIAHDYDLPIEAVREAIAYCEADPPEIQEDFAREAALVNALGVNDCDYKSHARPKNLTPQQRAEIDRGQ